MVVVVVMVVGTILDYLRSVWLHEELLAAYGFPGAGLNLRYLESSVVVGRFSEYLRSDWVHGNLLAGHACLQGGRVQFEIPEIVFAISSTPVTNYLMELDWLGMFDSSRLGLLIFVLL